MCKTMITMRPSNKYIWVFFSVNIMKSQDQESKGGGIYSETRVVGVGM